MSCVQLFCDRIDCGPPGSSVHGISQVRILAWGARSFSRGSSWPRNQTHVSYIDRWILYHEPTEEAYMVGCRVLNFLLLYFLYFLLWDTLVIYWGITSYPKLIFIIQLSFQKFRHIIVVMALCCSTVCRALAEKTWMTRSYSINWWIGILWGFHMSGAWAGMTIRLILGGSLDWRTYMFCTFSCGLGFCTAWLPQVRLLQW